MPVSTRCLVLAAVLAFQNAGTAAWAETLTRGWVTPSGDHISATCASGAGDCASAVKAGLAAMRGSLEPLAERPRDLLGVLARLDATLDRLDHHLDAKDVAIGNGRTLRDLEVDAFAPTSLVEEARDLGDQAIRGLSTLRKEAKPFFASDVGATPKGPPAPPTPHQ